jgi:hypothetical protein
MNGTAHCYMFRFPKNHHQASRKKKKPSSHTRSRSFCTIHYWDFTNFRIRPSTLTGQLISFTAYSKHSTSHQFTSSIFQRLTSLKLTFTRMINGHWLKTCTTIKFFITFEKYCPSLCFSPLSPHRPQICTVSSQFILQEKRKVYILPLFVKYWTCNSEYLSV